MDIDKRKVYNEKYYNNNRIQILAGLTKKVKCERCNRIVSYSRMSIHLTTKLCDKFSKLNFV